MKKMYLLLLFILSGTYLNLIAQTPQYYNLNTGTSSNSFPFNMAGGKAVNTLILPGEINQPTPVPSGMMITKIYFRHSGTGTRVYTNLHILLAQDTITNLTSGAFYSGTYDTVYFKATDTLVHTAGSYTCLTLNHPYPYDPTKSLIMFVGQCGTTGAGGSVYNSTTTGYRRVWSVGGCPFVAYASGDAGTVNFGIDVVPAVTNVTNRYLKLATPGVSTTYVQVPFVASMVGWGNNITIEAWVKPGGTTTAATVLNKGTSNFDYQLGISLSTMLPFFRAGSNIATCPFAVTANVWQHLAAVSNGSTVTFYLNGVAGAPVALACVLGSSTNEMRIGRGNNDAGSGGLDEIRVWSVARTGPEILSNMCVKWIPNNTPGLKAKWHFDSTAVDSVSGWNGVLQGTATYDTLTFCPIVVGVTNNGTEVPTSYRLEQNYPNPFNPTTNIKFSIPKSGYVEIKIYDVLGKEMGTLVSDPYLAGTYIVGFNASKLASGVYFYRIVCNDYTKTMKMMVLK
ncbi:MAG: T9SS type A sorting domain-containing protein [Bacteroidetes bacterium]|nr:T9SS type A sorting domain-containing protein [Bacteroidota bacterium]